MEWSIAGDMGEEVAPETDEIEVGETSVEAPGGVSRIVTVTVAVSAALGHTHTQDSCAAVLATRRNKSRKRTWRLADILSRYSQWLLV